MQRMEPGTSSTYNVVNPRNIVMYRNKTIAKEPRTEENSNNFNNANDYLEGLTNDLRSPESEISQDSEDYYDVTMTKL
ncbi:hypothetical protein KPH14_007666 [Odynerus spinipes]|uniref:Uncharacterized protein n=1 Tax=Odynerus spinipes TaxID=1348599 RepID=A0AAD9VN71_9HYME|nr:hypothetical protein KPH14_007666 [Odynerus spinipes]